MSAKVMVCTGSGRKGGLGEAIVERFAKDGYNVVITDIGAPPQAEDNGNVGTSDEMHEIAERMTAHGVKSISVTCDVCDPQQVQALIDQTVVAFGRLDVLVNNAAIGYLMKPIADLTADDWRRVIDVNLTGPFFGAQAAAAQMRAQGHGGRIINIASQAAKSAFRHMAPYVSSKHGLIGLTRSAAIDFAPDAITVNAVCPNHVTTELGKTQNEYFAKLRGMSVEAYRDGIRSRIPLGRVGLPEDTASVCAFLASDAAAYITGEAINVSGGEEMH
ncbi:MAG: SDR family NAD(P)-dependent oxidoreductase [Pseudomonadota bacterium]